MKRYSSVFDVRKVILNTCSVLSYNDVLFNIGVILRGVPGWGYRPGEFSGSLDFEAAVLLARKGMTIFWKTKGESYTFKTCQPTPARPRQPWRITL